MSSLWNDRDGQFNPISTTDYMPKEKLQELQLQRMKTIISWAYKKVKLFNTRCQEKSLTPR